MAGIKWLSGLPAIGLAIVLTSCGNAKQDMPRVVGRLDWNGWSDEVQGHPSGRLRVSGPLFESARDPRTAASFLGLRKVIEGTPCLGVVVEESEAAGGQVVFELYASESLEGGNQLRLYLSCRVLAELRFENFGDGVLQEQTTGTVLTAPFIFEAGKYRLTATKESGEPVPSEKTSSEANRY